MHFQSTTFFLAAAVIFQGVSAQFCTGPPPDCNFEDVSAPATPNTKSNGCLTRDLKCVVPNHLR
ncbi:hypothetical protein CTRI78_v006698 [Colletotrichum trifolii]|uniref:Uncharacterized protein n=1 Tax=Colletotrichum trifolii TaxID=5466 RepID=A0A4R8RBU5_COLTR|nr:hypothetical protein CTRI78_v006698 [Colletotrichum trifolii]